MNSTTSACTVAALKNIFAWYGIPEIVRSDNGPPHEFTAFAITYHFQHITSSPLFPQSNGQVERMVQMMKKMLTKSNDICKSLLNYRSTPLPWCNLSLAELPMVESLELFSPSQTNSLSHSGIIYQNLRVQISSLSIHRRRIMTDVIVLQKCHLSQMIVKCGLHQGKRPQGEE